MENRSAQLRIASRGEDIEKGNIKESVLTTERRTPTKLFLNGDMFSSTIMIEGI